MTKFSRSAKLGIPLAFCFTTLASLASLAHGQETVAPAVPPGPDAHGSNYNDTYIGFRYSDDLYFPGSAEKVKQKIGFLTTAGTFAYGKYVFNVDYLVSDENNPEAGGTRGAQETYSVGRVDFSASRVLGHPVGFGIFRDFGVTTGFEFSSKNDAFENRARMLVLGPSVQFAVPRGYWNAMIGWRTESNYNGIVHRDVDYDTAAHAESSWLIPFNLGPASTVFKGFITATGPKGKDGFHVETRTEVLARMSLLFDIGALAGHPRTFYAGPGYEYWHNMFGTSADENVGTKRSAATVVAEIHF
jgi:hypothetical protein